MGILENPRHELFAQEVAIGTPLEQAYAKAGYSPSRKNAQRLKTSEGVSRRIEEILSMAAKKAGVTIERIQAELANIAFADIRKAVEWHGSLVQEEDNPDGGDVLVIKNIFTNHVRLIDSDKIDDHTAAAISEVRQTKEGLSIKFHDKKGALELLGRNLGMFKDKVEHEGTLTVEIVRFSGEK